MTPDPRRGQTAPPPARQRTGSPAAIVAVVGLILVAVMITGAIING